jgi:hypothetical protein
MLQLMPSPAVIQKCLGVISTCAPSWQDNLATGYLDNDQDKKLLTALSIPRAHPVGFSLVDGLIQFHNRIQVGHNKLAQQHVLQALHSSGIGGHSGIQGTYQRVKCLFAWPKMKQLVTTYVQSCEVCQQAKSQHVKLPGLLQTLLVPN